MKNFCSLNNIIKTMKDNTENGRKYWQIMYLMGEFVFRTYGEFSVKKWTKNLNRDFFKENV